MQVYLFLWTIQLHTLSMQVISTVLLQLVELSLALALLQYTAMAGNDVQAFFASKVSTRNWIKETIICFTVLMILVWITSILADKLVGSEVRWLSHFIPLILHIGLALSQF